MSDLYKIEAKVEYSLYCGCEYCKGHREEEEVEIEIDASDPESAWDNGAHEIISDFNGRGRNEVEVDLLNVEKLPEEKFLLENNAPRLFAS